MSERQGKESTKYKNRYNASNYDSLRIVVPKGRKADIEAFAKRHAESVNGLVNRLLREVMAVDENDWKKDNEDGEA